MGHTYLANHEVWRKQIAVLSESYRCIVPDLWGHGLSSAAPDKRISMRSLVDDYWVLMQALDIREFAVLGLAVGGMWAIQMALDYPKSVNALVLINPGLVEVSKEARDYYSRLLNLVENDQHVSRDVINQLSTLFFSASTLGSQHELTEEFAKNLIAIKGDNLATVVNMGRNIIEVGETIDNIERLDVPTLILSAENARVCSPKQSRYLSEKISGAHLRFIPESGHFSCLEQPDIVNQHLREFLGRVYPASASSHYH